MTVDIEALIAQAQPRRATVALCLRGDVEQALIDAEARGDEAEVGRLRGEVAAATVRFVLHGLSYPAFRRLQAEHPGKDGAAWDLDTFPPALVRACLKDPVVPPSSPLWEALTWGQMQALFDAAFTACAEADAVPLPVTG